MSGTVRMTGISNGPKSEDQPLIFHDKNGRVFDKPEKVKKVKVSNAIVRS